MGYHTKWNPCEALRSRVLLLIPILVWLLACDRAYQYPRDQPEAAPTRQAARLRVTQRGLTNLAGGIGGVLARACPDSRSAPDDATCVSTQQASGTTDVHFFLGSPDQPINFNVSQLGVIGRLRTGGLAPYDSEYNPVPFSTQAIDRRPYCDDTGGNACLEIIRRGTGTTGQGFCRDPNTTSSCNNASGDYCCGRAAPYLCSHPDLLTSAASCGVARSSVALDTDSMQGNVHIDLIDSPTGDAMRVTVGCTEANLSVCRANQFVRGSLDMTMALDTPILGDVACEIQSRSGRDDAFTIKAFSFLIKPRVETGTDGRPHVILDSNDISVERFEVGLDFEVATAHTDPACYDEGWAAYGLSIDPPFGDCDTFCGAADGIRTVVQTVLEQGVIAQALAGVLAQQVSGAVSQLGLDVTGRLILDDLIPIKSRGGRPVGFLAGINPESFGVTGPVGALGLNLDLDVGFAPEHSPCVPLVLPPAWVSPVPPDPPGVVYAPDPTTGQPHGELYDAAVLLGDVILNRAAHGLYQSGSLCLALTSDTINTLSNGAFALDVNTLNLLANGLTNFASPNAPVDLVLMPSLPPSISFGTGAPVTGGGSAASASGTRDSHIKLLWSQLGVELYPLLDDSFSRALGFAFDLHVGLTIEPTPTGGIMLMIDTLKIDNVAEYYNEMLPPFHVESVQQLMDLVLPLVLTGAPISFALTSEQIGIPLVPKIRSVQRLGDNGHFLGVFASLCVGSALHDPANPLCFEAPSGPSSAGRSTASALHAQVAEPFTLGDPSESSAIFAQGIAGGSTLSSRRVFQVDADGITADDLEIAYRIDNGGAWHAFRSTAQNGELTIDHPIFLLPGDHTVTLLGRSQRAPGVWTQPLDVPVHVFAPPVVQTPNGANVGNSQDGAEQPTPGADEQSTMRGCASMAPAQDRVALILFAMVAIMWRVYRRQRRVARHLPH